MNGTERRWIVLNVMGSMYDDEVNSTYAFVVGKFDAEIDEDGDIRIDERINGKDEMQMRMFVPRDSLNFMLIMTDDDLEGISLDFKYGEDGYNLL